jgi:thiol-disulfide isomerase/thioredoxin
MTKITLIFLLSLACCSRISAQHDQFVVDTTLPHFFYTKGLSDLLAPYKGSVVYVDFWASWCGHCLDEMNGYEQRLQKRYAGKEVKFVFISLDAPEDTAKACKVIHANHIKGAQLFWGTGPMAKIWFKPPEFLPTYMLFDKQGRLVNADAKRPSDTSQLYRQIDSVLYPWHIQSYTTTACATIDGQIVPCVIYHLITALELQNQALTRLLSETRGKLDSLIGEMRKPIPLQWESIQQPYFGPPLSQVNDTIFYINPKTHKLDIAFIKLTPL